MGFELVNGSESEKVYVLELSKYKFHKINYIKLNLWKQG